MPEYRPRAVIKSTDPMVRSYLETAEWCGLQDEECEAFELSVSPAWSVDAETRAERDCNAFREQLREWCQYEALPLPDDSDLGHDFYLTRNRHGAGFWDGDYSRALGKYATDLSHQFGGTNHWFDIGAELLREY